MISFAINHALFGFDARAFKTVNLLLHLVNGFLVYLLGRRLLAQLETPASGWLAAAAASLWLLHPLHLSSVLYVVQRMNLLASLFCLTGMLTYLAFRQRGARLAPLAISLLIFTALAGASKETGLLLPVYVLLIEYLLLSRNPEQQRPLFLFHCTFTGLPALLAIGSLLLQPEFLLSSYANRDFTMWERLLTEARALWFYLGLLVLPLPSRMGLFHDDFILSTSLLTPTTTAFAAFGIMGLASTALYLRERAAMISFAIALFLLGHSLESSIFPLELVFEHRNYLPTVGLCIALPLILSRWQAIPIRTTACLLLVMGLVLAAATGLRSAQWSSLQQFSLTELQNHPESARSQYAVGRLYARSVSNLGSAVDQASFGTAIQHFARATELSPRYKDGLFALVVLYSSQRLSVPEGIWLELMHRLERGPINNSDINQWHNLKRCVSEGFCTIDTLQMNKLSSYFEKQNQIIPDQ